MIRKAFSWAFGAVALGSIAMMGTAFATTGPTCTVGPSGADYTTIHDAVNDLNCTTINVAAGTYSENVTIDHAVTLNGANAGIDARNPVARGPESVISSSGPGAAIDITAPGVVVDGFEISSSATDTPADGITVSQGGSGAVIRNNIFNGITDSVATKTCTGSPNDHNLLTAQAVDVSNGPDNVAIVHNLMENISSCGSAKGVFIGDSGTSGNGSSDGVTVAENAITGVTSRSWGAYGVTINRGNGHLANYGLEVENNTITGLTGGWVHAIGIEADAPNAIISGNAISNLNSPGPDKVAIWFESEDASYASSRVNQNNFYFRANSGVYGVAVDLTITPDGPVDGTCNYWNNASGPSGAGLGGGAPVTPLVNFSPWLKQAAPSACPAVAP